MSELTEPQKEALETARRVLGEHFDTSVIAVLAVIPAEGGGMAETTRFLHNGGRMAAIGLAAETVRAIQSLKNYEPYDDDPRTGGPT